MFLVAYPNEDKTTEFEFNYWMATDSKTEFDKLRLWIVEQKEDKPNAFIGVIVGLVISMLCVCFMIYMCCIRSRKSNRVAFTDEPTQITI